MTRKRRSASPILRPGRVTACALAGLKTARVESQAFSFRRRPGWSLYQARGPCRRAATDFKFKFVMAVPAGPAPAAATGRPGLSPESHRVTELRVRPPRTSVITDDDAGPVPSPGRTVRLGRRRLPPARRGCGAGRRAVPMPATRTSSQVGSSQFKKLLLLSRTSVNHVSHFSELELDLVIVTAGLTAGLTATAVPRHRGPPHHAEALSVPGGAGA